MPNNYLDIMFSTPINTSCQVGDEVYKTAVTSQDGNNSIFAGVMGNIIFLGHVDELMNPSGTDLSIPFIGIRIKNSQIIPDVINNDFLIFSKSKKVNTSGLIGYYAKTRFKNSSKDYAELFSVGSLVEVNSK
tara:strand:+ start:1000 stop:1395 length:396 start_codon:yes stop_codon:yes gene_type:complete